MKRLRDNENIFVLGIFLGLTGLLSAMVLAAASQLTAEPRRAAKQRDFSAALRSVMPEFDNRPGENTFTVKSPAGWDVEFCGALRDGKLVGVAGSAANPGGYAGPRLRGSAPRCAAANSAGRSSIFSSRGRRASRPIRCSTSSRAKALRPQGSGA